MTSKRIGIVGLGLLGGAFARRFIDQGIDVFGYDISVEKRDELKQYGAQVGETAQEVFDACSLVLLSLPNSDIAASLISENDSEAVPGQIVIDTTTGDPETMIANGAKLAERGVGYVEATVAGSSVQAYAGDAAIFVGGDNKHVEAADRLLDVMSKRRFHLGPVGAASRFKLVHNLVLGLNRAVLAEGLAFAQSQGFSMQQTLDVLKETPAYSGVMDTKGNKMVGRDYALQARLSQHLKDVRLILAESERTNTKTPLSKVHRQLLEQAEELGFGSDDNSAVIEAYLGQVKR